MSRLLYLLAFVFATWASVGVASAFKDGWLLQPGASSLTFTARVVDGDATPFVTEIEGEVTPDGAAELVVSLDRIDSGDKLRDARVRFLLFESFRLPQARVRAQIDGDLLAGLAPGARVTVAQPITLEMNEVTRQIDTVLELVVIAPDVVSVAPVEPILLDLAALNYLPGLAKLEGLAGVRITPSVEVQFELLFRARAVEVPVPDVSALQACARQIEAIAQSDQVYFTSGSAELETKSFPLLNAVAETLESCPGLSLRIEGHTDDRGPAAINQRLSVGRAAEVVIYLVGQGVDPARLNATGFGEDRPIADNTTKRGRWQNRRIEFVALGL